MKQLLLAMSLVCLTVQFGCTNRNDTTTQAAREPRMSDSDLKAKIENNIKSEPQLANADISVSADAEKNHASLSGTVDTEATRSKVVEMARNANPGLTIDDKIDVKPLEARNDVPDRTAYTPEMAKAETERARTHKETVGGGADDAWIHAKIVGKLIGDKDTPERKINVDVDHNVVTLRGVVDTAVAKTEAERIAKETDGVKSVRNMLKVEAAKAEPKS